MCDNCIAELVSVLVRLPSRSERRERLTREVDAGRHGGKLGGKLGEVGEVDYIDKPQGKGNLDV